MNLTNFYDCVERDDALEGVDVVFGDRPDQDEIVVKSVATGHKTRLATETIRSHPWETLREVILGQRDPAPLFRVSRIVGYFSRIENWNKSKLGELADRHAGNYHVSSEAVEKGFPQ